MILASGNMHVIIYIVVYLVSYSVKIYLGLIFRIAGDHLLVVLSRTLIQFVISILMLFIEIHHILIRYLLNHQRITYFLRLPLTRIHIFHWTPTVQKIAFDSLADFCVLRHQGLLVIIVRNPSGRPEITHQRRRMQLRYFALFLVRWQETRSFLANVRVGKVGHTRVLRRMVPANMTHSFKRKHQRLFGGVVAPARWTRFYVGAGTWLLQLHSRSAWTRGLSLIGGVEFGNVEHAASDLCLRVLLIIFKNLISQSSVRNRLASSLIL